MALIRCPYCGSEASDSAKFCPSCGKPLDSEETVVQRQAPSSAPVQEAAPVKQSSKTPIYIALAVVNILLVGVIVFFLTRKKSDNNDSPKEDPVEAVAEPVYTAVDPNKVYSKAYDGFVVMKAAANYYSAEVGRFRNGPVGATFLGEDPSGWTQINYNGIVGWVNTCYVSRTPTKEVTVNVSGAALEGIWSDGGFSCILLFDNGRYMREWESGGLIKGEWLMEGDMIRFSIKSYQDLDWIPTPESCQVIESSRSLSGYFRKSYLPENYDPMIMGGGDLGWTQSHFNKLKTASYYW